jgi:hypothetical protein
MHRLGRDFLTVLAVTAFAAPAFAANKQVEAGKVFTLLGAFQKLPAAARSTFTPAYYLRSGGQPLAAPVWLVVDGKRTPLPLRADGRIERLPSGADLDHGKIEVGVDAATKLVVVFDVEPLMPPATDLDARELAAAVAQASLGARKSAGILSLVMPKLDVVVFIGAGSGEIEFADGHRAPLPVINGAPTYNPATQPDAKRIRLTKVPTKLDIGPAMGRVL